MRDDWEDSSLNPSSIRYFPLAGSPGTRDPFEEDACSPQLSRTFSTRAKIARAVCILFWIGLIALGMWSEQAHHH